MLENVHVDALGNLGTTVHPPDDVLAFVEKFICELYQPGTGGHSHVKELRWYMFGKKISGNRIGFHQYKTQFS